MKLYPMMMNIEGRRVVVVGGGTVALRKVRSLLQCGAAVTVISPDIEPELRLLAEEGSIQWLDQPFDEITLERIDQPVLVFGTTDRREVNEQIFRAAVRRGIPCNIADDPEFCTFTVPAVVSRGDLTIAVSTGGASPALARRIRERLELEFGSEYGVMTKLLASVRHEVLAVGNDSDDNKRLFFELVDSELLPALKAKDREKVKRVLHSIVSSEIDVDSLMKVVSHELTG